MPKSKNAFFTFKQFTVHQDLCAMKVCTDACVLGAWTDISGAQRILDIGAGTGLLSMMMAQRNSSTRLDAVELEENAFVQAQENVKRSPFPGQIQVLHMAIQDYFPEYKYDHIVSNPPFFQSDLRSPDALKNKAHHAESLSFSDLLESVDRLLTQTGTFDILLPVDESVIFQEKALARQWRMHRKLTLYHQPGKRPFRKLMRLGRMDVVENAAINDDLFIYEPDGKTYHTKFIELMKDYYLIF